MSLLTLIGTNLNAKPVAVGEMAPDLVALDENGQSVRLADLYAKGPTLVYFYPKASTPGCTAQACSLRDNIVDLGKIGVQVIGVSHDTPAAQRAFKEKHGLPFTLIADFDGRVISAFGVPTVIMGIAMRHSFLVKEGRVAWHLPGTRTATHADEVMAVLKTLK